VTDPIPIGPAACWAEPHDISGHISELLAADLADVRAQATATGVLYPKANRTAQWFGNAYPGTYMPVVRKVLLHTTETGGWPGYAGGASAPQLTFDPRSLAWHQHNYCNWSGRALRDPSNTVVRENQDGVIQIEIIACSDLGFADRYGYLRITQLSDAAIRELGAFIAWAHITFGVPLRAAPLWLAYPASYGNTAARMTGPEYDRFEGVLGHQHASGNSHGDPNSIPIGKIMAAAEEDTLPTDWFDDMATEADLRRVVQAELAPFKDLTLKVALAVLGGEGNGGVNVNRNAPDGGHPAGHYLALIEQVAADLAAVRALVTPPEPDPPA